MTEYRIAESERFRVDFRWLPPGRQRRVLGKLRAIVYPQLRAHPHFGPDIRRLPDWDPPL